ncbi:MAG TPA: TIR domain-containing protein [Chthoniobacterales bacterium]|nr:TIR domain-containing protein [Chthoniobacterales bacterium]
MCHSWKDSHAYAEAIVRGLEPDLRCFIDSRDFEKGASWTIQGAQALRRSTMLIVVLSPGALSSEPVYDEVTYFVARRPHRRVVTININETYSQLPSEHRLYRLLFAERLRIPEIVAGPLETPSESVLLELKRNFRFVHQNTKRLRILKVTIALLLGLSLCALFAAGYSQKQRNLALLERNIARVGEGRFYLERAKQSISGGVGTYPLLPIYASRAVGFPTTGPVGERSKRFPQLLSPDATPDEYQDALRLAGWNLAAPVLIWSSPLVRQHANSITLLQSLPGSRLFSLDASGYSRIWNLKTNTMEGARRFEGDVSHACASLDEKVWAVCSHDGQIAIFNADTWFPIQSLAGGLRDMYLSLDEHGRRLSITGKDTVEIWEKSTGNRLQIIRLPQTNLPQSGLLSPTGDYVAVKSDGKVTVYDVATGKIFPHLPSIADTGVKAFSWCGRTERLFLVGNDGSCYITDIRGATERIAPSEPWGDGFSCFVSPSGRFAVSRPTPDSRLGKAMLWDLPAKKCLGPLQRFPGRGPVSSFWFSKDDQLLYGGSTFGTITAWQLPSGRLDARYAHGHGGPVYDVAFSPDGSIFASAGTDGTIEVWDSANGSIKQSAASPHWNSEYRRVTFLGKSGVLLALDRAGLLVRIQLGHPEPIQESFQLRPGQAFAMAVNPDTAEVAVGFTCGRIEIRKLASLHEVDRQYEIGARNDPEFRALDAKINLPQTITALSFSPGGRRLACAISAARAGTDQKVLLLDPDEPDHKILIIDPETGQKLFGFEGDKEAVNAIVFSPVGDTVASGGLDGKIRFYGCSPTPKTYPTKEVDGTPITSLAYSIDGHFFAAGTKSGKIRLWDTTINQAVADLLAHSDAVNRIEFSPDGSYLLSSSDDGTVKAWEIASDNVTFGSHVRGLLAGDSHHPTIAITMHNGGTMINVVGEETGGITGRQLSAVGLASSWAYNAQADLLVLGGNDLPGDGQSVEPDETAGRCELWRTTDMEKIATWTPRHRLVKAVAISPSGRHVATAGWEGVRLWDTANLQRPIWETSEVLFVETIAFSPDGKRLIFSSSAGKARGALFGPKAKADPRGNLFLADASNGEILRGEQVPTYSILALAINPRGDQLAVGTNGAGVFTYDLNESSFGSRVHHEQSGSVDAVAFNEDGTYLGSSSNEMGLMLWPCGVKSGFVRQFLIKGCSSIAFGADRKTLWLSAGRDIRKVDLRPADYLQYFYPNQTIDHEPSKDWFQLAGGGFNPLDKNNFLDRNQEFGFVNLRGNTLGEQYRSADGEELRNRLFWRFYNARNWPAAWAHCDQTNSEQRTSMLLGLAAENFVPTARTLLQGISIEPVSQVEIEASKGIKTMDKDKIP